MLYIVHIYKAFVELASYFVKVTILRIPVSYPGNARTNPQTRIGKWKNKKVKAVRGWKFAESDESHKITNARNPKGKLTGEPAGRQIWYMDTDTTADEEDSKEEASFDASDNPNSADKLLRRQMIAKWKADKSNSNNNQPDPSSKPSSAREATSKAISYYQMLQCDDGHWAGDYGGPMFLMPGLICVFYLTKTPFPPGRREAMIYYLQNHQQEDGGWGTHIECASTMFGTVLNYTALRLLGVEPDAPGMTEARSFMHKHGGALYAPSWAKFWLAAIGVYDWRGINSVPVEMWLLPRWFIFHPGRLWCHCRMVYLPMGYVYCKRFTPNVAEDPILLALRKELYLENYDTISWDNYRQTCADIDQYTPLNPVMKVAQDLLAVYETYLLPTFPYLQKLRDSACSFCLKYMIAEDLQTNYIDIGPVNKAMNMLCMYIGHGCSTINNHHLEMHMNRVDDYLWVAEDGMKMQGYNGSQAWDTAFMVQAMAESGLAKHFPQTITKAYSYFDRSQIKNDEDSREYWFRHISKGGWPFSNAAHGWPISDCTAEGLKSVVAIHSLYQQYPTVFKNSQPLLLTEERLMDAVNVLLSYQNTDGGWATYENNRGYGWYELLNPSEVFGDIMIDYSYVECTSACMTAMKSLMDLHPEKKNDRMEEMKQSIRRGRSFLKSIQRKDGSWYGSWGNCFNYGTWFGVEGLVAAGEPLDSPAIRRAVQFLLGKQNPNGGWGESYLACVNKAYPNEGTGTLGEGGSGVVQTAWALLALMKANCQDVDAIRKGKDFLMKRQLPNGDWEQEGITGVFNRSCGITYSQYRNSFPIWALARYAGKYEK